MLIFNYFQELQSTSHKEGIPSICSGEYGSVSEENRIERSCKCESRKLNIVGKMNYFIFSL